MGRGSSFATNIDDARGIDLGALAPGFPPTKSQQLRILEKLESAVGRILGRRPGSAVRSRAVTRSGVARGTASRSQGSFGGKNEPQVVTDSDALS